MGAIAVGDIDVVKALLDQGANVNTGEWTALMWAAWGGQGDTIEILLDRGADMNAKDQKGLTALGLALKEKQTDVVELLREHGAME